jgi:GNAT superfamily N-acetyltransferase
MDEAVYLGTGRGLEVNSLFSTTVAERLSTVMTTVERTVARSWPSLAAESIEIAESTERDEFCNLPHLLAISSGRCVAVMVSGDVFVVPEARGRGIGAELLLTRAILHDNGRQEGTLYSPDGYAAARASYRLAIEIGARIERGDDFESPAPSALTGL